MLDKNECWMTEAFDTNKLYYSSDSAKTFSSLFVAPTSTANTVVTATTSASVAPKAAMAAPIQIVIPSLSKPHAPPPPKVVPKVVSKPKTMEESLYLYD